jgi:hypothetical protein
VERQAPRVQADSDRRRAPQRLLARTIKGYAEGVLSAQAITTLRGITREAAEADPASASAHRKHNIGTARLGDSLALGLYRVQDRG